MYNLLIIGAGQLGSRHLQSLAKLTVPVSIEVVDPGPRQLSLSMQRFEEIPEHKNISHIAYHTALQDARSDIDLCIIATTADVRSEITKQLIDTRNVKNIIFEKILFQSLVEYDEIERLLIDKGINAWVNCPRRMYPFYQQLKPSFQPGEKIFYHVSGGAWGLACNAIHFVDHMSFFNGEMDYSADIKGLDNDVLDSKRKGFIELGGVLEMTFSNKSKVILHSNTNANVSDVISIFGETSHVVVFEPSGKAFISDSSTHMNWQEHEFRVPYQSELTSVAVTDILLNGCSDLTRFGDSAKLHRPLIQAINAHIEVVTGCNHYKCPIT